MVAWQGLYCCVKENHYRDYAIAPLLLTTLGSICLMAGFYFASFRRLRAIEEASKHNNSRVQASRTVMRRGIRLVISFYGCWSVILICGIITAQKGRVLTVADMVGAWLSKCMPLLDGLVLLHMLDRVERRNNPTVEPRPAEPSRRPTSHGDKGRHKPGAMNATALSPPTQPAHARGHGHGAGERQRVQGL
jgi:hypothetical protein